MKKVILIPLFLVIVLGMVTPDTYAFTIKYAFVFADRFPDEAGPLGFTPGNVLQIGAMVKAGDFKITEATATNLDTGLVLALTSRQIGAAVTDLLFNNHLEDHPFPPLNPDKHQGIWEIRIKDEKGDEAVAKIHKFDKAGKLPYVENIKASGNQLSPMITWTAPKREETPSKCKIKYRVRLLKDVNNQFYRSKKLLSDTKEQIPEGLLKPEEIPDTYVRIETQCWDTDDTDTQFQLSLNLKHFGL